MASDDEDASFGDRVATLRERLESFLEQIDVRAQIEAHPWELVGAAALRGAWLGFEPPRVRLREPSTIRVRVADAVLSAIGAIAIRLVREAAFRQVADIAKRWWEESASKVGADGKPEAGRENGRRDTSHA